MVDNFERFYFFLHKKLSQIFDAFVHFLITFLRIYS